MAPTRSLGFSRWLGLSLTGAWRVSCIVIWIVGRGGSVPYWWFFLGFSDWVIPPPYHIDTERGLHGHHVAKQAYKTSSFCVTLTSTVNNVWSASKKTTWWRVDRFNHCDMYLYTCSIISSTNVNCFCWSWYIATEVILCIYNLLTRRLLKYQCLVFLCHLRSWRAPHVQVCLLVHLFSTLNVQISV